MLGLWAWSDDIVAVLFEFLDDDTKLAQSCTDWLYLQHWYIVVPEPAMRVTLWALMGAGGNCEVCHTTGPLTPILRVFSVSAEGSGTGNRDAMGSSVCVLRCLCVIPRHLRRRAFLLLRSPWQDGGRCQPRFDVTHSVGSLCEMHHTCDTCSEKMLTARYVQSSAVAAKCVGSGSLFFRTVCVLFCFTWFAIILSGQETDDMSCGDPLRTRFFVLAVTSCACVRFFYRLKDG